MRVAVARQSGRERSLVFMGVGGAGYLLQLAALAALTSGLGLSHVASTAIAVELALLHNFVWHERWTWVERAEADPRGFWRRLARFHAASGLVSIVGNVLITDGLVRATGMPLLVANSLAVGACTLLNFMAADRLVFQEPEVEA